MIKRILITILVLSLSVVAMANQYTRTPQKQTTVVNASVGKVLTLTGEGILSIYCDGKLRYELTGVTPSATLSPAVPAGSTVSTEQRYYVGNKIGVRGDSATVNVILLFQNP